MCVRVCVRVCVCVCVSVLDIYIFYIYESADAEECVGVGVRVSSDMKKHNLIILYTRQYVMHYTMYIML